MDYPHYRHDEFVEVSDEVWEVMRQAQREMNNYERRKVYHRAWYSLDAYSWTENYALEHGRSPEEILLEREERAAHLRLLAALPEALAHATPTQARRVRAYYIAGISQPEISRREGVDSSKVSVAIRRGLRNMRRCYDCPFPGRVRAGLCRRSTSSNITRSAPRTPLWRCRMKSLKRSCWTSGPRPLGKRKMYRYKAFYSLDCDDGIENAAIGWAQPSPEDCLMEKEAQAEYAELLRRLYEAISSLTPTQARRVHARYMLGMKVKDIAAMEGITPSQAGKSIHAALRRLRRYFIRRKWTSGL